MCVCVSVSVALFVREQHGGTVLTRYDDSVTHAVMAARTTSRPAKLMAALEDNKPVVTEEFVDVRRLFLPRVEWLHFTPCVFVLPIR